MTCCPTRVQSHDGCETKAMTEAQAQESECSFTVHVADTGLAESEAVDVSLSVRFANVDGRLTLASGIPCSRRQTQQPRNIPMRSRVST